MRFRWLAIAVVGLGCGGAAPVPVTHGLLDSADVGLAASGSDVYAIDGSKALVRIAPDDSTTQLAANAGLAYVIKADAAHVYWTDGTSARMVPLAGGDAQVLGTAPTGWNVQDLGPSGGDRVFWLEDSNDPSQPVQTQLLRAFADSSAGPLAIDRFDGLAFAFTSDADALYWAGTSGVFRRDNADGATASVARLSAPAVAGNVVSDGIRIYWTEQDADGDALYAVARTGGQPQQLAHIHRARALALDGQYVYLRTDRSSDGSCIEQVPISGGESQPIAHAAADGFNLAVGSDAVFWLERGQLMRLRKASISPNPSLCDG